MTEGGWVRNLNPSSSGKKLTAALVLIWTDSGSRLGVDFVEGPLSSALGLSQSLKCSLLPIVNYKPMMGLNSHLISKSTSKFSINEPQSVPALHHEYGHSLRTKFAARDPFYDLTEVFALVASSEKQFLNLMEMKLENAIFNTATGLTPTVSKRCDISTHFSTDMRGKSRRRCHHSAVPATTNGPKQKKSRRSVRASRSSRTLCTCMSMPMLCTGTVKQR